MLLGQKKMLFLEGPDMTHSFKAERRLFHIPAFGNFRPVSRLYSVLFLPLPHLRFGLAQSSSYACRILYISPANTGLDLELVFLVLLYLMKIRRLATSSRLGSLLQNTR